MPIVPADRINPLIASFIQTDIQLTDIAEQHGIPLRELLEWLRSPEIAEILDAIEALSLRRARVLAAEARVTALRRLDYLAASSDDPESARRAGAAILRAAGPLHDNPDRPPSPPQPSRRKSKLADEKPIPHQAPPAAARAGPPQPAQTQPQPRAAAAAPVPAPVQAIADSRAPTTGAVQPLNPAASVRAGAPREAPRPSGSGPAP